MSKLKLVPIDFKWLPLEEGLLAWAKAVDKDKPLMIGNYYGVILVDSGEVVDFVPSMTLTEMYDRGLIQPSDRTVTTSEENEE